MDWNACIVCQEKTEEPLKCPLNATGAGDQTKSYNSFLKNVGAFRTLGTLPVVLHFGENITIGDLVKNQAAWHKSCHLKFCQDKLDRAERKREKEESSQDSAEKRQRRQSVSKMVCLLCRREEGHLHEFTTFGAEKNIRKMATQLQETELMARMEGSDLVALDAKYHLECLTSLRNRYRSLLRQQNQESSGSTQEKMMKARALVELVTHIENSVEEGTFFFKVSELHRLYENRLRDLGMDKETNRTRFKENIIGYFPEAQEQSDGKHKVLVFPEGMQQMLKQAMACDHEGDVLVLAKAAKIVRKEITNFEGFHFDGTFPSNCQHQSVPSNLKTLVSMLLNGADLKDQDSTDSQASITISQTTLFNYKKHAATSAKSRHSLEMEPPLPLYIGMKIHTETRSKKLIGQLFDLGLSVSYDRVLQLESQLATAVCENFMNKGTVVPAQLRHGLFTVGALDNLDHNPSSTSAKGSFHGTGISLFQFPGISHVGEKQDDIRLPSPDAKKNHQLPDSFTTVPAVVLKTAKVSVPPQPNASAPEYGQFAAAQGKEENWLKHATQFLEKDKVEKGDTVTWSAFHASALGTSEDLQAALTQLLPLFYEKAATAAMIKHGLNVVHWATEFLNPGQIPVLAFDAPLYALAKFTQWNWPDTHGEDKFVAMFGGLHIEMAIWTTYGDYLEGSGWTNVLSEAGIASTGTADSMLKASHLTRTRHAHQVTAVALAKLQQDAFLQTEGPHNDDTKEAWKQEMIQKSPTFQYWDTVLNMELAGLIFVRSHREENFALYVESLKAIVPWFFALDHHNYARWIPVHIRDMESLPASILNEFEEHGHWVVHKTTNRFSSMPIDQAHEQNNAEVKGSGGAVGLTENPSAFRKWMVSGPEQARILKEFEEDYLAKGKECNHHHEEGLSLQRSFKEQSESLADAISELGNPFLYDGDELLALDTRNVLNESVVNTVRRVHELGKEQYAKYHKEVIVDRTRSIHEPIKKNALPLFRCPSPKSKTKQAGKISSLKSDVALFSHLYIIMQKRDSDMNAFFKHENLPCPPSLSNGGKLRTGKKSDLLEILEQGTQKDPPDDIDVKLLDGAAVVHLLPTAGIVTFDEYADQVFLPHIMKQLENCKRVDVVWDAYVPISIKESTREKRGKGIRRKVAGKNKLPGNWADFLRDSKNKQELFAFLSSKTASVDCPEGKEVIITCGVTVTLRGTDRSMPACDHEEADTRLLVHVQDAILNGCTNCMVRTVDTDVVVILIGKFHHLITLCPDVSIWVAFGTGKHFTYHHINAIYAALGTEKSMALPLFHSFTGCDTTSAFFGKGKKSAWEAWKCYPDVTSAFTFLALNPYHEVDADDQHFQQLERLTVVLYDKASDLEHVDEARKELYCQKERTMDTIPPTQDALLQHSKRSIYQAGIWSTSDQSEQHAPTPEGWGWTLDEDSQSWVPVWSTIPVASKACSELVKCGCTSLNGCGARCACKKALWKCTLLCSCNCEK
jgi:hypothetical protein